MRDAQSAQTLAEQERAQFFAFVCARCTICI